ncbi:ferrochelatase [Streptococcus pneumoniae]|nr:ferrochelatase [Streptococcus pneumoniae]
MKKAILMMTFGSPEEIIFEGVADFFTNIRRGVRPYSRCDRSNGSRRN